MYIIYVTPNTRSQPLHETGKMCILVQIHLTFSVFQHILRHMGSWLAMSISLDPFEGTAIVKHFIFQESVWRNALTARSVSSGVSVSISCIRKSCAPGKPLE